MADSSVYVYKPEVDPNKVVLTSQEALEMAVVAAQVLATALSAGELDAALLNDVLDREGITPPDNPEVYQMPAAAVMTFIVTINDVMQDARWSDTVNDDLAGANDIAFQQILGHPVSIPEKLAQNTARRISEVAAMFWAAGLQTIRTLPLEIRTLTAQQLQESEHRDLLRYFQTQAGLTRPGTHPLSADDINAIEEYRGKRTDIVYRLLDTIEDTGSFTTDLYAQDREKRSAAVMGFYKALDLSANSPANTALVHELIKITHDIAQLQGYDNSTDSFLSENNIPVSLSDKLVQHLEGSGEVLSRYYNILRRLSPTGELTFDDLTATPTVLDTPPRMPFVEAIQRVLKLAEDIHPEFGNILSKIITERYDSHAKKGKDPRDMTFMMYAERPLIVTNLTEDDIERASVLRVLVHEAGHAVNAELLLQYQQGVYRSPDLMAIEMPSQIFELMMWNRFYVEAQESGDTEAQLDLLLQRAGMAVDAQYRSIALYQFTKSMYTNPSVLSSDTITAEEIQSRFIETMKPYTQDVPVGDSVNFGYYYLATGEMLPYRGITYSLADMVAEEVVQKIINGEITQGQLLEFFSAGSSLPTSEAIRLLDINIEEGDIFDRARQRLNDLLQEIKRLMDLREDKTPPETP
ncbi:MAG: M3 family metallopeptidase [Candidatus Dojkabacteria bacterium]